MRATSVRNQPSCHPQRRTWAKGLCNSCYKKEWRALNPAQELATRRLASYETYEAKRQRAIVSRYSITIEDYQKMFDEQDGRCAICRESSSGISLCIDHDHLTGAVRGLLCTTCNKGLGHFSDDISLMETAITYLKRGI